MCCVVSQSFKVLLMNNQRLILPLPVFSSQTYKHYDIGLSPSSTPVWVTTLSSRFPWCPSQPRFKKQKQNKTQVDECIGSNGKRDEIWTCLSPECLTWQKSTKEAQQRKGKKNPARSLQTQVRRTCTPCVATLWWFNEHMRWSCWREQGFLWPTVLKVSVRCFGWSSWFWPLTKAVPQSIGMR